MTLLSSSSSGSTRGSGADRAVRLYLRTSGGPFDPRVEPEDDGKTPA
ncbi:hypothetical protein [Brevundimonas sp. PAMC22021]|nr:hypothetical protein [Brevundimonas sp. PAMC22021]QYF87294.1 hypothetical protein KY493_01920 [Brevundimonas sp. PAMC22021]